MDPAAATHDFRQRIAQYEKIYVPLDPEFDAKSSWVKCINCNRFIANNICGLLQHRVVQLLMHMHTDTQPIYLTRHGESEYNQALKIGGDSGLTARGEDYARRLATYAEDVICKDPQTGAAQPARLWISSLRRTSETIAHFKHPILNVPGMDGAAEDEDAQFVQMRPTVLKSLDELYAGVCDGMTLAYIQEYHPEVFMQREACRLAYRYPRGESYLDVIQRLQPVMLDAARCRVPVLIVSHQAVLRVIYAYLTGLTREEAPYVSIPLDTVIKVTPGSYPCDVQRSRLLPSCDEPPSH
eukprot:NODE_4994_length_1822_cov_7.295575.p1 GENE.NODE_4994_length_1822_cov_7.295575~~NODE_4994_length_1822_cov_7.295575.p1  ORF type:complete len:297 (+),score=73.89 NODE_4994_length_1822_cov_7.295575:824-1714(+)